MLCGYRRYLCNLSLCLGASLTQNTQAADAFMAVFGMRRVVRPTDEQRMILVASDIAETQKPREWALKRATVALAGQDNEEQTQ